MTDFSWLSTKTQKNCSHCGEELVLIDPTDVLATRPIEVSLICPVCQCQTQALLTVEQLFRSIYPQLLPLTGDFEPSNDNDNDNAVMLKKPSLRPGEAPPPGGLLH